MGLFFADWHRPANVFSQPRLIKLGRIPLFGFHTGNQAILQMLKMPKTPTMANMANAALCTRRASSHLQHHLDHRMTRQGAIQRIELIAAGGRNGDGNAQIVAARAGAQFNAGCIKRVSNWWAIWVMACTKPSAFAPIILIGKLHGYWMGDWLASAVSGGGKGIGIL